MSRSWVWDETRAEGMYESADEESTHRLGRLLAAVLPPGTVVALAGTLGAGKTRLVQGIATGLGIDREQVVSPTFGICHEHPGSANRPGLNHLDLYRVADADELLELGFDEYCGSDRITVIEWADRFVQELPRRRLDIELLVTGEGTRRMTLRALDAGRRATGADRWLVRELRTLGELLARTGDAPGGPPPDAQHKANS